MVTFTAYGRNVVKPNAHSHWLNDISAIRSKSAAYDISAMAHDDIYKCTMYMCMYLGLFIHEDHIFRHCSPWNVCVGVSTVYLAVGTCTCKYLLTT